MELKQRLRQGLEHARGFTDRILGEIQRDEDWIRRPTDNANHALWIAGHLAYATNAFIGFVDPSQKQVQENFPALFGKGSQLQDTLSAYPTPNEVVGLLSERGQVFLGLLDACSEEDFVRPVPQGPAFMHDVGAVFQLAAWHEALHAGQLTTIHRMLGNSPLTDR